MHLTEITLTHYRGAKKLTLPLNPHLNIIVRRLRDVFPNIQFIISTHSPHVLTHVQADEVFLMQQTDDGLAYEKPTAIEYVFRENLSS